MMNSVLKTDEFCIKNWWILYEFCHSNAAGFLVKRRPFIRSSGINNDDLCIKNDELRIKHTLKTMNYALNIHFKCWDSWLNDCISFLSMWDGMDHGFGVNNCFHNHALNSILHWFLRHSIRIHSFSVDLPLILRRFCVDSAGRWLWRPQKPWTCRRRR